MVTTTEKFIQYTIFFLMLSFLAGCSPLNKAVGTNNTQLLKRTIAEGSEDITGNPEPLITASKEGFSECVEILLEAGANPNLTDSLNRSPMYWAAKYNHPEIIKILLDAQASTEIKTKRSGRTPLMEATTNQHYESVEILLKGGASPNTIANNSDTPLIIATWTQQFKVVKTLLENGADPNLTNSNELSPLYSAVYRENLEITKLLIEHGAYLDTQNNEGVTPLMKAVLVDNLAIVRELITSGADIDKIETTYGTTPLYQAGNQKHYSIADYLIRQGADKGIAGYDGGTLHQLAINTNDIRLLEISKFNMKTIMLAKAELELREALREYQEKKTEYGKQQSDVDVRETIFLQTLNDNQLKLYSKYMEDLGGSKDKAKILLSFREFSGSLDSDKKKAYVALYADIRKTKSFMTLLQTMNLNLEQRKQVISDLKIHISEEADRSSKEERRRLFALRNRQQAIANQQAVNTTNWRSVLTTGLNSWNESQAAALKQRQIDSKHTELINSINGIQRTLQYGY